MTVAAILLVPAPEHRDAVLSDGPCGSRAPVAVLAYDRWHGGIAGFKLAHWWHHSALVLAWGGKPVPDGVFRAWDAWSPDEDPEFAATGWTTYDVLAEGLDSMGGAEWLARAVLRCWAARVAPCPDGDACPDARRHGTVHPPPGRAVLLDASGREVAP